VDREWGYDERAPRDRRSARTWSTSAESTDGSGEDRWWFTPERKEDRAPTADHPAWYDGSYATGEWEYRDRSGSWPAADGWLPRPQPEPRRHSDLVHVPYPADDEVESTRGQLASLLMTVVWYATPIGLYLLWALTLGGAADANCVDDAGNPCPAPQDAAIATITDSAPRLVTALALSLVVAIVIRWITGAWRATTVGFASSVVGAGIATVIFSVLARTNGG
jgi:hypothetical protein